MDKIAFSAHYGRELALRLFVESEGEELSKVANAGEEVDSQEVDYLNDLVGSLDFREHQQKLAHNNGAYEVLHKVAEALESDDFDADAFRGEVKAAMEQIEKAASTVFPENDQENTGMIEEAIKNAAVTLAALHGVEVDENINKIAEHLVNSQLTGSEEEDA